MVVLTKNLKIAIGILLLLGIPINFLRNINAVDTESLTIAVEITALTVVFGLLMWKRSKWGFIGGVGLVTLGIMLFSVLNIIDILTGVSESLQIWLSTELISLGLSILFLLYAFKAYREQA
ncbi:MAG: hypothetical protein JSV85_05220 [Candidatus Bathyarchaeota archaeon]|nr:MAG: hypothetical protein JSV85_05220 [Candidatus Bathyarchaeota archaeon]